MEKELTSTNSYKKDLLSVLQKRKSIRAFDKKVPELYQIKLLFEAARWAPSSSNNQPWRYIFATSNEQEKFNALLSCLADSNQIWASKAPVLILSLAKKLTNTGKVYKHNLYDTGAANMALSLQAVELGMQAHIMGGFDAVKIQSVLQIEEDLEPIVMIVVGYPGDINELPENLRLREVASSRLELKDILI